MMTLKLHALSLRTLPACRVNFCSPKCLLRNSHKELSYESIPRSPHVPIFGSLPYLLKSGGPKQLHNYINRLHKKLGPLFVDTMNGTELLFVSDPDSSIQVFREEGQYPVHFVPEPWTMYLNETGQERGLFFMDGPEWLKNRQILNGILLRSAHLEPNVQQILNITKDLVSSWKVHPPAGENLERHLYRWNIECLGALAFGSRLGFIDNLHLNSSSSSVESQNDFVTSIHNIFKETSALSSMPLTLARFLNVGPWKRFCAAVSNSLMYGRIYVQQGVEKCMEPNPSSNVQNSLLYKLLKNEKVDIRTSTKLIVDLMFASADTTSHCAVWALYLLGRHPKAAESARKEISELQKRDAVITWKTLNDHVYLKGVIKEVLRLYPTASFLTRLLNKESEIHGYSVPAGTMVILSTYTMGRDPHNFSDPNSFNPERWIRQKKTDDKCPAHLATKPNQHNPKAYTPWGLGARTCIGRRIAEMELLILLISVLQSFNWVIDKDVDMVLRMIPVPAEQIELNLKTVNSLEEISKN